MKDNLELKFNLKFNDLYCPQGLDSVDREFEKFFALKDYNLFQKYFAIKSYHATISKKELDQFLIDCSIILEEFLINLFSVEKEFEALFEKHKSFEILYNIKREFVQRVVAKKYSSLPAQINIEYLLKNIFSKTFNEVASFRDEDLINFELNIAKRINILINQLPLNDNELELLTLYCVWALYSCDGKKIHRNGILFNLPKKIDYNNLCSEFEEKINNRDGFNLLDKGFGIAKSLEHANYCIFCHKQDKDSCRSGIKEKDGSYKSNPLNIPLKGCPLDQKISEMNFLKSLGHVIASAAVAIIDNPLVAGTGHRICNDCMKSCIYQKQDPVNIPQIETENLKDLLQLPWGFEIYSLLTKWNPLKLSQNFSYKEIKENSGKNVLVAGLGPAGYTLSHYLLCAGYNVVAIDGLKIEPLSPEISGVDFDGNRHDFKPIKFIDEIFYDLSKRQINGFGGVSEYGITVRWNKNFLTIIRLLLERQKNFRMFGGIRFGSSIDENIAFKDYEFDHVALCVGAGRPQILNIKNNFAKGVRSASDFLMSLQLSGAFKDDLFTNLQIRAPIIIIGGGLTAVDAACESQEYYFTQIKKFKKRYKEIIDKFGEENFLNTLSEEEKIISKEFNNHCEILDIEGKEGLLKIIGRTKILYRKNLINSQSYKLNHEELIQAFEQGIEFIENEEIDEIILDDFNYIKQIRSKNNIIHNCKSLLYAIGTNPNISIVEEDKVSVDLQGKYIDSQISKNSFIAKIFPENKSISFFGDLHPNFEGSVVKAMASAKYGFLEVNELLKKNSKNNFDTQRFFKKINNDFSVKVNNIEYISDNVIQLTIKSHILSKKTEIGHIFRLQNYHNLSSRIGDSLAVMESVAVTALEVDRGKGLITGIITLYGASTNLIKNFKIGDDCIFMGPSGNATEISKNENVLLIGGGRGHMPLTIIAKALKANNCNVILAIGYNKNEYVVKQDLMCEYSDILIYAINEKPKILAKRSQDIVEFGLITDVLIRYFANNKKQIDRIITIGGNKMMSEISRIRHEKIIKEISDAKIAITSLNSPMQCMMKGVCSQCLQKRIMPDGSFEYFYSCANQDQNMDLIDFNHLNSRCDQNSLQEKISKILVLNKLG